jgi:hypothetical protein
MLRETNAKSKGGRIIKLDVYVHLVDDDDHPHHRERLTIRINPPTKRAGIGEGIHHMATQVTQTDEQKSVVSYDFSSGKDRAGNPAPIDPASSVDVQVDDPSVATVDAVLTPTGADVTVSSEDAVAAASVGQTQATVTITQPNGGEVITDVIAVTITPSSATQITGSVASPTPR